MGWIILKYGSPCYDPQNAKEVICLNQTFSKCEQAQKCIIAHLDNVVIQKTLKGAVQYFWFINSTDSLQVIYIHHG